MSDIDESSPALGSLHSPLRDLVTARVRNAILAGRYKPGERLIEDKLAADFQVSRNPVREALRSLATEGLVALTPRRGAAVATISRTDAQEMVEVRAMLEGLNARHAARRHDPIMIIGLRRVIEQGHAAAEAGNPEQLAQLNGQFHDMLAEAGSNRVLGDLMRSLRDRTNLVFAPMGTAVAVENWREHQAILEAVISGDEELASLHATRHVMKAGERFAANTRRVR